MAKPKTSQPSGVLPGSTPRPSAALHMTKVTWPKGQAIHRIHQNVYAPNAFNPGVKGNARFSPVKSSAGNPIPTLYGGTTFDCAAMESIFHDVPFAPGFKSHDKRKLEGQVHSVLVPSDDPVLVDLSNVAMRKLGVRREQLIDTEKDRYPDTRLWAEAFHTQFPDVQGLCWISRQDDRARAIVLFGDRIAAKLLVPQASSRNVLSDLSAYGQVLALAGLIGVSLVAGKA